MSNVVWWEIETSEIEEFQRFHSELSGWTFVPTFRDTELGADYWVIRKDGADLGGLQRAGSAGGGSAAPGTSGPGSPEAVPSSEVRVYLRTDDLESRLEQVVGLGGTVERARVGLDGTQWFALFRDPAGVLFGLWTASPPR